MTMKQPGDFGFNEQCAQLKHTAREFLQNRLPAQALHALVADDPDPYRAPVAKWDKALWQEIIELGWHAVVIAESAGGVGMPLVAAAALMEEAGRVALPSPLLGTLQSTCVLNACGTPAAHAVLETVARGSAVALALLDQGGTEQSRNVTASKTAGGHTLNGVAHFVQDAAKSDVLIVRAGGLYAVPVNASGVKVMPDHIVDLTRDQAHIEFDNASATLLADRGNEILRLTEPARLTLLAADMVGAAEWQLQTTVDYAKSRVQFDRPIGFFQAVKHPLVDLMVLIDQARALVYAAACAIDHQADESGFTQAQKYSRMAKAAASDMAAYASRKSIQLHGGIGFTWECFVHLYAKRQKHSQVTMGDATYHRRLLADIVMGVPRGT
jgi:alkylation response protein AidB-like acyl-CoA dehydrogenase